MTPSVSGKCSPAELIARELSAAPQPASHAAEVGTGFEPVYTALQAVASPLGHPTESANRCTSSGRRDSNPRPSPWQGDALPTALRPLARVPALPCNLIRPDGEIQTRRERPSPVADGVVRGTKNSRVSVGDTRLLVGRGVQISSAGRCPAGTYRPAGPARHRPRRTPSRGVPARRGTSGRRSRPPARADPAGRRGRWASAAR